MLSTVVPCVPIAFSSPVRQSAVFSELPSVIFSDSVHRHLVRGRLPQGCAQKRNTIFTQQKNNTRDWIGILADVVARHHTQRLHASRLLGQRWSEVNRDDPEGSTWDEACAGIVFLTSDQFFDHRSIVDAGLLAGGTGDNWEDTHASLQQSTHYASSTTINHFKVKNRVWYHTG